MRGLNLLKQEILDDPLSRGYDAMSDEATAMDLNSTYRTRMVALNTRQLLEWGASARRLKNISDGQGHADPNVANLCMAATALIGREDASLDLRRSEHVGMIDFLVGTGVLVAGDKDALTEMATQEISRAAELGLRRVKTGHVEAAKL